MSSILVQGREIKLNDMGYVVDFSAWDEDLAKEMAAQEGVELTDCHWVAIRFLRDYYHEYEVAPSPRTMIQAVGHKLMEGKNCTRKDLNELFPGGGCKQACRFAGLPTHYCSAC